jgi:uncharacterized protein (TIGR03086 family)
MSKEQLVKAFSSTKQVLSEVKRDQLGLPTPCRSWTLGQLVNHMIAAPRYGLSALTTGEARPDEQDYAAGDYLAAYDTTMKDAIAAFDSPGATEKNVKLPFGEVSGAFLMTMITTDQFTHGWDLAKATGQSTDLDPGLAAQLLSEAAIPDQFRGEDGVAPFGPAQEAPQGATEADKLAAHLGRTV